MSALPQPTQQQLQQDLQNELTTSNQLLRLIALELNQIKQFTGTGGEFETNIKQNAKLISSLASIKRIDIENLPPIQHMDVINDAHQQNLQSHDQHDTIENSNMDI